MPLITAMLLMSLWPVLPKFGLFFLARELQSVHGSWPQVMVDDPKNWVGHASPQYDTLFHLVNYLNAFSGAWMIVFLALFFAAKAKFSLVQRRTFISLTLFFYIVSLFDPGNLGAWWMD